MLAVTAPLNWRRTLFFSDRQTEQAICGAGTQQPCLLVSGLHHGRSEQQHRPLPFSYTHTAHAFREVSEALTESFMIYSFFSVIPLYLRLTMALSYPYTCKEDHQTLPLSIPLTTRHQQCDVLGLVKFIHCGSSQPQTTCYSCFANQSI